jgi:hypothetical protein
MDLTLSHRDECSSGNPVKLDGHCGVFKGETSEFTQGQDNREQARRRESLRRANTVRDGGKSRFRRGNQDKRLKGGTFN